MKDRFITRGIPSVALALGVVGCTEDAPNPFVSGTGGGDAGTGGGGDAGTGGGGGDGGTPGDSRDAGTGSDTGAGTDSGPGPDAGMGSDTGLPGIDGGFGSDAGIEVVLTPEEEAAIERFCTKSAECDDYGTLDECRTYAGYYLAYAEEFGGAACRDAYVDYLEALANGTCVVEDIDGYEEVYLEPEASFDIVAVAIACTDPSAEEMQVARDFCAAYVPCSEYEDDVDDCVADALWEVTYDPGYLDFYDCLTDTACVDGELDPEDECEEPY